MFWKWATAPFLGLTKGWWLIAAILAAIALVVGFNLWLAGERRAAVEADRHEARAEALETARGADEAAQAASEGESTEIEDGNERARNAASGSDDPLRDGLDSLRAETGRNR